MYIEHTVPGGYTPYPSSLVLYLEEEDAMLDVIYLCHICLGVYWKVLIILQKVQTSFLNLAGKTFLMGT